MIEFGLTAVLVHMLWKLVQCSDQDTFQTVNKIFKKHTNISNAKAFLMIPKTEKSNAHMKHDDMYSMTVLCL